ncbi:serine/threonine protein kinase [Noviherbaspirillum sp. UKPF54]|uniref:serine/threonine protein kinase n=1 Tax=Noviherbaspirillum sp. UKPF54 TaxID=2601898 RepID=UPI0011B180DC|nr:serine/threonine protein kinase [Noviherbaspirillum sp. UKPF54]QDZ28049.1 protein kinase [Noviherbaspirillum sp. UKPF54]
MASIANAIQSYRSGGLTHNQFLAQVDRQLAADQANSARQLEQALSDEQTRMMLPPEVYAELQRRVEYLTGSQPGYGGEETRVQTGPGSRSQPHPTSSLAWGGPAPTEPERMKGIGDTLNGRFVLEECLGFGGMGTVYKALDLRKLEASDRKPYIAIKVLNVQFRGHPKSLITLQREARKAQQLAHPNIVMVYDFDRDGSTVYLTMEYLSGKPLSQVLRAKDFKGLPYAEAMRIVNGMGKALAYAHERGFVHCDFKPANVILTDRGEVKVIDFGIARVFRKPEEDSEATVFDPGSLGGLTPAYASPEMLEHRDPDPRDDIYALACITYELLTGRHPFDRFPALHARGAGMKPQRPEQLGNRQWRALKAALSFDRETRTPSVERFLQEMGGSSRPAPHLASARLVPAGAGVALAALLALGVVYFWRAPGTGGAGSSGDSGASDEPAQTAGIRPQRQESDEHPAPAAKPAPPPALSLAAVTPVLERMPCSALAPAVQGNTLRVQGYLSRDVGVARLKETLNAIPGVQALELDVHPVGADKCGVIQAYAPYWIHNRQSGGRAAIRTKAARGELTAGDPLVVDVTTPDYQAYVNIDYYVLDGSVVHMVPSPRARANQAPPNYAATIGSLGNWVIAKPFGNELIALLVTPVPLFDTLRPEIEPRADYLRAVQARLRQIAEKHGRDKIAADFVQITTRERK